jgi:hypothetical protein
MSYRQAKELVKKYYPFARLHRPVKKEIKRIEQFKCPVNGNTIKSETVSQQKHYRIWDFKSEASVSGEGFHSSIAKSWIAAADLIQPKFKLESEVVIKRYPLAEAWLKKAKKRRKKEFKFEMAQYHKRRWASLPVS